MTAAGWRNKDVGERIGEIPTTLIDALQLSEKKVQPAAKKMLLSVIDGYFVSSSIGKSHLNIFLFLDVSLAIFIVDCELVSSTGTQHEIVTTVQCILRLKNIDYVLFLKWCKSSSDQFRIKNVNGLAYENIGDIPHDTQCDARTILQMEKRHKQAVNLLSTKLTTMSFKLTTVKNDVSEILQLMKQRHPDNKETKNIVPSSVAPHDLTLNPSFQGWFVNDSIRQNKNTIEIFIHWNKYSLLKGHDNDKRNKTKHNFFAKYSKLYKTMKSILLPTLIDNYPHNGISNQIAWEKKYTKLLSEQFIQLELVGKSKKRTVPINVLEKYAKEIKKNKQ